MIFTPEQLDRLPGSTVRLRNGAICTTGEQKDMRNGFAIFHCDEDGTDEPGNPVCYAETQGGPPVLLDIIEVIQWADEKQPEPDEAPTRDHHWKDFLPYAKWAAEVQGSRFFVSKKNLIDDKFGGVLENYHKMLAKAGLKESPGGTGLTVDPNGFPEMDTIEQLRKHQSLMVEHTRTWWAIERALRMIERIKIIADGGRSAHAIAKMKKAARLGVK